MDKNAKLKVAKELACLYSTGMFSVQELERILGVSKTTAFHWLIFRNVLKETDLPTDVVQKIKTFDPKSNNLSSKEWWHDWWSEKLKNPRIAEFYKETGQ